jgi:hypothetical protein
LLLQAHGVPAADWQGVHERRAGDHRAATVRMAAAQ